MPVKTNAQALALVNEHGPWTLIAAGTLSPLPSSLALVGLHPVWAITQDDPPPPEGGALSRVYPPIPTERTYPPLPDERVYPI